MNGRRLVSSLLAVALSLLSQANCSKRAETAPAGGQKAESAAAPAPAAAAGSPAGSITASPNPIKVCDASGLGVTAVSWNSTGTEFVEVHVGSPDGALFAASKSSSDGSKSTEKWVTDGMVLYLQNTTGGLPLTPANTLAKVTLKLTNQGCP
jgi:hypothetical protein